MAVDPVHDPAETVFFYVAAFFRQRSLVIKRDVEDTVFCDITLMRGFIIFEAAARVGLEQFQDLVVGQESFRPLMRDIAIIGNTDVDLLWRNTEGAVVADRRVIRKTGYAKLFGFFRGRADRARIEIRLVGRSERRPVK